MKIILMFSLFCFGVMQQSNAARRPLLSDAKIALACQAVLPSHSANFIAHSNIEILFARAAHTADALVQAIVIAFANYTYWINRSTTKRAADTWQELQRAHPDLAECILVTMLNDHPGMRYEVQKIYEKQRTETGVRK